MTGKHWAARLSEVHEDDMPGEDRTVDRWPTAPGDEVPIRTQWLDPLDWDTLMMDERRACEGTP